MTENREKLENMLPGIRFNVVLRDYVSLRVGGVADCFYTAETIKDFSNAILAAAELGIPYFILAGGYNVVPSDSGFPGLIIKNESSNIIFSPESTTVVVDSGVNIGKLINLAAGRDLGGMEFLFGVPGTIGGAIYGNAGAFNHSIGDYVKSLTLLFPNQEAIRVEKKSAEWMEFSYRSSHLKKEEMGGKRKPVILTATLQLVQRRKDEILRLMQENIAQKKETQPLGENSAGSFFKNPPGAQAAAYLLEQSGAKGLHVGGAAFSKRHANFLINKKNAKAEEIRELAEKAKEAVRAKYNLSLEEEVEYIGKW